MFQKIIKSVLYCFFILFLFQDWCFFVHKEINSYFIYTLEKNTNAKDLYYFYKKNYDYIVERSCDPDIRRSRDRNEGQKHFFNMENFGEEMMEQKKYISFSTFKEYFCYNLAQKENIKYKNKKDLDKKIKEIIKKNGMNPWAICFTKDRLVEAFKAKDCEKILFETVNLAHYVSDSCVPFHATDNYDGQKTNQHGIHKLWEKVLPVYFFDEYNIRKENILPAKYLKDYKNVVWRNLLKSNKESVRALKIEKELSEDVVFCKFCYKTEGKNISRIYSKEYSKEYNKRLNGQVKKQIRTSISLLGDLVYTSWVDAGCPKLLTETEKEKMMPDDTKDVYYGIGISFGILILILIFSVI